MVRSQDLFDAQFAILCRINASLRNDGWDCTCIPELANFSNKGPWINHGVWFIFFNDGDIQIVNRVPFVVIAKFELASPDVIEDIVHFMRNPPIVCDL